MMASTSVLVPVVDRSFGLLDDGITPSGLANYSTGLVVVMSIGARIHTGIDTGPVWVRAVPLAAHPPEGPRSDTDWTEVVEAGINLPHGNLRIDSLAHGLVPGLPLLSPSGPGWYRVLVKARGRDVAHDAVVDDPVEDYEITIWPEPPSPPRVFRAQDRCGHGLRLSASGRPAPQPRPVADPYGSAAEQERQETLRAHLLRAMGAPHTPAPDPAGRPWRPEPDRPAPKPRGTRSRRPEQ
jgi:hypothetical protein